MKSVQISTRIQLKDYMPVSKIDQSPRRSSVHKTFLRNEHAIQKALNFYISERSRGVSVRDICRDTGISSPTFYAHSPNINSAYQTYECSLVEDFIGSFSGRPVRSLVFTLLLSFAYRHRDYFRATSRNADFYILSQILDRARLFLVGGKISDQSFTIYRNEIASIIMIWANLDHFKKTKVDFYLQKITQLRIREW